MNSIVGRFHLEKVDEKEFFVYHLDSPDEESMDSSPIFACPQLRFDPVRKWKWKRMDIVEIDSFPYVSGENESSDDNYEKERLDFDNNHYVLPLFWCKNKENDNNYVYKHQTYCIICTERLESGTDDYYLCVKCDDIYHKKCFESPLQIKHPYHPEHPLKLSLTSKDVDCVHCRTAIQTRSVYYCSICNMCVHNACAFKSIPFVLEETKRHDHPLTFCTRKDHLRCNVCGLLNNNHFTYICLKCDFVVHQDCANSPNVIRISRHHHRISFTSTLPLGKWICGVCRKKVDGEYGAYTCNKCDHYVVHSRCALRKDIWDGKELEDIAEEDDIEEILDPFERRGDGSIRHFLHDHTLQPKTRGEVYDESKICDACVLPIYEGRFYSCMECNFILHDKCANAPRKIRNPLHPHILTLKISSDYQREGRFKEGRFSCQACYEFCSGFIYECNIKGCFSLDVGCGSISEPFDYQGHEHHLYLALDPKERHVCKVCQTDRITLINCIECDYIICLSCLKLPYMVMYKHDKHFLTLVHGKETNEPNWCEVCERLLSLRKEDYGDKRYYECKQCCTTLHIECLLGKTPYLKPGHTIDYFVQVLSNNSLSRPNCGSCGNRCVDKLIFNSSGFLSCCLRHAH